MLDRLFERCLLVRFDCYVKVVTVKGPDRGGLLKAKVSRRTAPIIARIGAGPRAMAASTLMVGICLRPRSVSFLQWNGDFSTDRKTLLSGNRK
jgi:hypothetical protein